MKKITFIFLLASFAFCSEKSIGQANISSPYSDYGVGLVNPGHFAQNKAMGGLSVGLHEINNINIANPASYTGIKVTNFAIGAFGGIRNLSKGDVAQKNYDFGLEYIAMAFPISKKWGASVGLLPFSSVGYEVSNTGMLDTSLVNYISRGEGGINRFYIGNAFTIAPNLSIGLNVAYLFGSIKRTQATEFPEDQANFFNSKNVNTTNAHGFRFSYGLQYNAKLGDEVNLTLGYSGAAKAKLKAKNSLLTQRYLVNQDTELPVDVLDSVVNDVGNIVLPTTHSLGFAISSHGKWLFGADVSYADWSDVENDVNDRDLGKTFGLSAGMEFTPDPTAVSNYLKIMDYRFGVKYQQSPMEINGIRINQTAFTAGIGMPLIFSQDLNSSGKFNIGVEFGQRGKEGNGLVKEQYALFNIGFTFSSRWFIKRKFN